MAVCVRTWCELGLVGEGIRTLCRMCRLFFFLFFPSPLFLFSILGIFCASFFGGGIAFCILALRFWPYLFSCFFFTSSKLKLKWCLLLGKFHGTVAGLSMSIRKTGYKSFWFYLAVDADSSITINVLT